MTKRRPIQRDVQKAPVELQPEFYRDKIKRRFWMTLNYLTIPLSSALIFGSTALIEYLLFRLVWSLLSEDILQSVSIKQIAEWVQIAIASMSMIGAVIHSSYSLYGTILIERQFAEKEG